MTRYSLIGFFALLLVWTVPASAAKIERVMSASGIEAWLVEERFAAMPKVTSGMLNEMADLKKMIVMAAVDLGKDKDSQKHQR